MFAILFCYTNWNSSNEIINQRMTRSIKSPKDWGLPKGLHKDTKGYWRWQPPMKKGERASAISLSTKDLEEAMVLYHEIKQDYELGLAKSKDTLQQAIDQYLQWHEREKRKKTSVRAKYLLPQFHKEICKLKKIKKGNSPKLKSITEDDLEEWINQLKGRTNLRDKKSEGRLITSGTVRTYSLIFQALFSWCVRKNKIKKNPFAGIEIPSNKRGKRIEFCTREERDFLISKAPNQDIAFVLHMGFYAGMRYGEMCAMKGSWIQEDFIHIEGSEVWQPKDGEYRSVEISRTLRRFLDSYGIRDGYMFGPHKESWKGAYRYDIKVSFNNFVERVGLPHVRRHTLRRSFATHLAQGGQPIAEIARLLGDDIGVTEQHYIGHSPLTKSTHILD